MGLRELIHKVTGAGSFGSPATTNREDVMNRITNWETESVTAETWDDDGTVRHDEDIFIDTSGVTPVDDDEDETSVADAFPAIGEGLKIDNVNPGTYFNMHGRVVLAFAIKPWLFIPCSDCRQPARYEVHETDETGASFFYCGVCDLGG